MARSPARVLSVKSIESLSPHMKRVILTGESLSDFPSGQASAYVKLVFDNPAMPEKPLQRSYTVVSSDQRAQHLTIDFAVHCYNSDQGPAARWLEGANIGDPVLVSGPGPTKLVDLEADWFVMTGDLTALPAIRANIEILPAHAKGYAVLEIPHQDDQQAMALEASSIPEGMEIIWVINPHPGQQKELLRDALANLPHLPGSPYLWAASELNAVLEIRNWVNRESLAPRSSRYISSYWQLGLPDEAHKVQKRERLTE
ncbi:siderophore-interacting protein [Endozoicomonas sp. 8E]|uniref:siderophore-interacting protein n=1 Tax=Endozoicomonas sp. 8E TaxID=3035692 RepID=UPI002938DB76|nr:siderophore-interacting protein [Endozoicomonas sp. 8E]WOG28181.1 siderophore-interacting protein [Endozoicomonas sp. 8E]